MQLDFNRERMAAYSEIIGYQYVGGRAKLTAELKYLSSTSGLASLDAASVGDK